MNNINIFPSLVSIGIFILQTIGILICIYIMVRIRLNDLKHLEIYTNTLGSEIKETKKELQAVITKMGDNHTEVLSKISHLEGFIEGKLPKKE